MIALILGTIITLAALSFVLYPLFADTATRPRDLPSPPPGQGARSQQAIAALREVEFDRATGKLSPQDYDELKAAYTREAVAAMRAEQGSGGADVDAAVAPGDDALEAVIRRYRSHPEATVPAACPSCGPRPEVDAVYCSSCGRYLAAQCPSCAAPIAEPGARFCSSCGHLIAPATQLAGAVS